MRVIEKTATRLVLANRSLKYQITRNYVIAVLVPAVFFGSTAVLAKVQSITKPTGFLTTLTCRHPESDVTCTITQVDATGKSIFNDVIRQVQGANVQPELISSGDSDSAATYLCHLKLVSQKGLITELPQFSQDTTDSSCSSMNSLASQIKTLAKSPSTTTPLIQQNDTRITPGDLTVPWTIIAAGIGLPLLVATFLSWIASHDAVTIDQDRRQFQYLRQKVGKTLTTIDVPLEDVTGSDWRATSDISEQLMVWTKNDNRPRGQYTILTEQIVMDGIGMLRVRNWVEEINSYLISPMKTYRAGCWIAEQTPSQLTIFHNLNYENPYADDDRLIYKIDKTTGYFTDRSYILKKQQVEEQEKRYPISTIQSIELECKPDSDGDGFILYLVISTSSQRQKNQWQPISPRAQSVEPKVAEWLSSFLSLPLQKTYK